MKFPRIIGLTLGGGDSKRLLTLCLPEARFFYTGVLMENKIEIKDEVLTTADVAKILKLSVQVIRKLPIPKVRFNRSIRYKKADVEAWIEAHKETVK